MRHRTKGSGQPNNMHRANGKNTRAVQKNPIVRPGLRHWHVLVLSYSVGPPNTKHTSAEEIVASISMKLLLAARKRPE